MARPEDWLNAAPKQRQALYRAIKKLEALGSIRFDEFVREATLRKVISDSYRENFRKGLVSRRDAAKLYGFLKARFADAAAALDVEAFTNSTFSNFLLSYRRLGLITPYPMMIGEPFVSHRRGPAWAERPFEIFEPISFRLLLPYAYQAMVGIIGNSGGWFPLRITDPSEREAGFNPSLTWLPPSEFVKPVSQGGQTITTAQPTTEEAEKRRGSNAFIFLMTSVELIEEIVAEWSSDNPISDAQLVELAERLSQTLATPWAITQINMTGIGRY